MITGVILARNEEHNILDCIAALKPNVSEVFVIDMESTDQTASLAAPQVDRVLTHPLVPNFDSARNIAIPLASNDWLWFVDADERIPEMTGKMVQQWVLTHGDEFEAINIPFKSYFCGQWMKNCGWWPGYTCPRVLKRGHFEFSKTLHGGVKLNGREVRFPASAETGIEHYSFRNLHHYVEKFNRYTSTESLQLAERGVDYDWRGALRLMMHDLWEHYELHNARLDGERGWILTWMAAQYRWMSVTKLIDHNRSSEQRGGPSSAPLNLDEFMKAMEEELASFRKQKPELPLGIVWRAAIWNDSPQAIEARSIVLSLARGKRLVTLEPLDDSDGGGVAEADRTLLKALERCRRARHVVTITNWGSLIVPPDRCAVRNVLGISTDEVVPIELMGTVNAYDEIWVESVHQKAMLRTQGAAPERIRIVAPCATSSGNSTTVSSANHEEEIKRIEQEVYGPVPPPPQADQIGLVLEGEFFAGHSFSNINEELAIHLSENSQIALSLQRVRQASSVDERSRRFNLLAPYMGRRLNSNAEITIRHAFPPNWHRPASGKWVHIQPWEFGYLPNDWLPALRHHVDEIWVMSRYVKEVYLRSGIAPEKIQLIPWGIDPEVFNPDAPPRRLATTKTFRFLYVGGTILRKGFDRVLQAYLEEFGAHDDVCLVIKDVGTTSFYAPQNMRSDVLAAKERLGSPELIYFDEEMTAGQLASLYTACHCLVAPYRGEGFGLPVLEALACSLPPIVPLGGPTHDFVDADSGYLLPSLTVPAEGVNDLCGPATEFHVSIEDLRQTMRQAYEQREATHQLGNIGSHRVRRDFNWRSTVQQMVDRLHELAGRPNCLSSQSVEDTNSAIGLARVVCVITAASDVIPLAESLARVRPFATQIFVIDPTNDPLVLDLAREYSADLISATTKHLIPTCDWTLLFNAGEYLSPEEFEKLSLWLHAVDTGAKYVAVRLQDNDEGSSAKSIRLARWEEDTTVDQLNDLAWLEPSTIASHLISTAPFCIRRSKPTEPGVLKEHREFPTTNSDSLDTAVAVATARRLGRLKKSVLIQMATGAHLDLLEITRDHHRSYAARHGMDYWCINGNPVHAKRAGWGKIPLLIAAMDLGYETVVWLDSDAVIVSPEVDLTSVISSGIGMVRHPVPAHWNTGMIIARSDPKVLQFWRLVDESPENNSSWMEQYAANELASRSEFSSLFQPVDLRFNSVPGYAMAEAPVIVAGHGLPMPLRRTILEEALAKLRTRSPNKYEDKVPCRREDFGEFLNRLCLCGEAAEIGVLRGDYSRSLLSSWRGSMLHLIDPWRHLPDYHDIANLSNEEFEECLEDTHRKLVPYRKRYQIHRMTSAEAASKFAKGSLDFVYLDANHSFSSVAQDVRLWFPKLRSGGILAGHDFLDGDLHEGNFGVASAVTEFAGELGVELGLTHETSWRSWYLFKP